MILTYNFGPLGQSNGLYSIILSAGWLYGEAQIIMGHSLFGWLPSIYFFFLQNCKAKLMARTWTTSNGVHSFCTQQPVFNN